MVEMTVVDFIESVKNELKHLKDATTQKEKDKLDFKTFQPKHETYCIYGQLTGDSLSKRALELTPKTLLNKINFRDEKKTVLVFEKIADSMFTPVEFIYHKYIKLYSACIIDYLKGLTDEIVVNHCLKI